MVKKSATWSPAEKVGSMDDLTTEILVRLPVRSLLRFKSVSKHWYSLISSPCFKPPNPDFPSGLFIPFHVGRSYLGYEFIPFDIDNPVKKPPFVSLDFNLDGLMIEHSCNGLMLCSTYYDKLYKYYIYNPTVNRFAALPTPETNDDNYLSHQCHMSLAFDPSKSPHYLVIYVNCEKIPFVRKSNYKIQIYSSQTRSCDRSFTFVLDEDIAMYFGPGVYWNEAFHWIHKKGFILYFNLDQQIVHQMHTPLGLIGGNWDEESYSNYLFESRGHLLAIEILRPHTSKFKIHELMRDYSGWSLRYNVDLDGVCGPFPEIMNPESADTFEFAILALVLSDKQDGSFLVLEIPGKVLRFNLVSKTFYKLHGFSSRRKIPYPNCNKQF
uniref:F-box protein At5g07610-like n=1 Tax=Erigeron canadensis TaxID=72917 RepID=UPI001CB9CB0C|nr:F-box protein At5g07610-like [Erigeron canadensis]